MKQLYSNCCHAEVYTHHGNEGTNCWICPACKEGCGVEEGELLNCEVDKENLLPTKKEMEKWLEDSYEPRVGDRVSVEGTVVELESEIIWLRGHGVLMGVDRSEASCLTLLSRKTRKLTKAEAEALLTEKLGESVEIENE